MTNSNQAEALPTGASRSALIAGLISVVTILAFIFANTGATMLFIAAVSGIAAVVFGIIAIRKRAFVGVAVTGLVLGALGAIVSVGILVFTLVFIGVFG
ncbi:hypothetical protein [Leucobacter luti]|uniref:DUF4190 domain-containing protein n=1 Tax=Leucobacter luti TaxID=340320 RepID=A0A4Q7TWB5_9MICO|nr:hypothetical protein [Leucobacter luti]MBL3698402.1 hypothetical protein [Leucobacter luti]RZT64510.1 hypothetical protein EV139_1928 [Leucobacter luti]